MRAAHLRQLAEIVADVVENDGGELLGVTMGEMGDGSGRSFALVDTYQCGLEQQWRVSSPAPAGGPSWTWSMRSWVTEVRVGDGWLAVDEELLEESA